MRDFISLWVCIGLIYVTTMLNVKLQTLRSVNEVLHFHNLPFPFFTSQLHVPDIGYCSIVIYLISSASRL